MYASDVLHIGRRWPAAGRLKYAGHCMGGPLTCMCQRAASLASHASSMAACQQTQLEVASLRSNAAGMGKQHQELELGQELEPLEEPFSSTALQKCLDNLSRRHLSGVRNLKGDHVYPLARADEDEKQCRRNSMHVLSNRMT